MVTREQYIADRRLQALYVQQAITALLDYRERLLQLEELIAVKTFDGATAAELREIDETVGLSRKWGVLRDLQATRNHP